MDVGVRELKAKLSEYLHRAADGEIVVVTERGHPMAVLGPLPGRDNLDRGVREGWITEATRAGLPGRRRAGSSRRVQDVLDDDRGT